MPSRISQMRNEQPFPQQNQLQQPQINEEYLQQLKALMHSANPQQFLEQAAAANPQLKSIFNLARNGNPQQVYEMLAHQYGVDPNWLLKKLMN